MALMIESNFFFVTEKIDKNKFKQFLRVFIMPLLYETTTGSESYQNIFMIHAISFRRAKQKQERYRISKQTSCDHSNIYQHLSIKVLRCLGKTFFYVYKIHK